MGLAGKKRSRWRSLLIAIGAAQVLLWHTAFGVQVTTTSLPDATQGTFYGQQLKATGGLSPYRWSLSPGSGPLPTGLSLVTNSGFFSGYVFGTPTVSGTFFFFARVTDTAGETADQVLSLKIDATTTIADGVTLRTLYPFTGSPDGSNPLDGLTQESDGGFYGTTSRGGRFGGGTVFRINSEGALTLLTSFGYPGSTYPNAGLVQGVDGALYGTTSYNGNNTYGTIFRITTNGAQTSLHSFSGNDGASPVGRLTWAGTSTLYGVTAFGGISNCGTIYKITTNGVFTLLHSFTGNDGIRPGAGLAPGEAGSLYGATAEGGINSQGTIFRITTNGTFNSVYAFTGGSSGGLPNCELLPGNAGTFYGTTSSGGAGGAGTIIQVSTNGALTTLYSFTGGADGGNPAAGLTQGTDGSLYGVTQKGGSAGVFGAGTLFRIGADGMVTTLYSFHGGDPGPFIPLPPPPGGLMPLPPGNSFGLSGTPIYSPYHGGDGDSLGRVIQGADGNLYGTTLYGGSNSFGTVYRLNFSSTPAPDLIAGSVTATTAITNSQPYTKVRMTWAVTNQGVGAAPGGWWDRVWLSTNGVFDGQSLFAMDFYNGQTLPPGGSYRRTNDVILPVTASGTYSVFVQANGYGQIFESNTNNNVAGPASVTFTLRLPDLVVVSAIAPTSVTSSPYAQVDVAWRVVNEGAGTAPAGWWDTVWFSTNGVLDSKSKRIGYSYTSRSLPPGGSYQETNTVQLPLTASGNYTLFVEANDSDNIYESDYANNFSGALPGTFTALPPPDLAVVSAGAPATVTSQPYAYVNVTWSVTNQGLGTASGFWYDEVWFSTNGVLDANSQSLGYFYVNQTVLPGGSYQQTNKVQLPLTASGNYTLFVQANPNGGIYRGIYEGLYEANPSNNVSAPLPGSFIALPSPDLAVVSASAPATVTSQPYAEVQLIWGVTNQGLGTASGYWYDEVWFSTNGVLDADSQSLGYFYVNQTVPPSGGYQQTNTIQLPLTASGNYTLFVQANANGGIYEANTSNNVSAPLPGSFVALPSPDLAVVSASAPATVTSQPYAEVQVIWGVTNQGLGAASGYWYDEVWFSTNGVLDADSQSLGYFYVNQTVPPGGGYQQTNTVQLPLTASGNYTLFVQANAYGGIYEANPSNNVSAPLPGSFVALPSPDLAVVSVSGPATVTSQPYAYVDVTWSVTNLGLGTAAGVWFDRVWFSTNGVLDANSQSLSDVYISQTLPPGGSYQKTASVKLPLTASGSYTLFVVANGYAYTYDSGTIGNGLPGIISPIRPVPGRGYGSIFESNTANNVSAPLVGTFTALPPPDLAVLSATAPVTVTSEPYAGVQVSWTVTNLGLGTASGPWFDEVWFSANGVLDSSSQILDSFYVNQTVPPGGSYRQTNTVQLPLTASGNYTLFVQANGYGDIYESDTTNNISSALPGTFFALSGPDLTVVSASAPATITAEPYAYVEVTWSVTNQGSGTASGQWHDEIWFSTNGVLDSSSQSLNYILINQTVPPGGSYQRTNSVKLPLTASGNYTLFVQANAFQELYEANTTNNVSKPLPGMFTALPSPDLAILSANAPTTVYGTPYPRVTVTWGVTNQGLGTAFGSWYDQIWFSTNGVLDANSQAVGYVYINQDLASGGSYRQTNKVTLPLTVSGSYTLFVVANGFNGIYEPNLSNNVSPPLPGNFKYVPADLAIVSATTSPTVSSTQPYPFAQVAWSVTNLGPGLALSPWYDSIWFSTNGLLDTNAIYLADFSHFEDLPVGGSYLVTNLYVSLPLANSRKYTLFVQADAGNDLYEANTSNNISVALPGVFTLTPAQPVLTSLSGNRLQLYGTQGRAYEVDYALTNSSTWHLLEYVPMTNAYQTLPGFSSTNNSVAYRASLLNADPPLLDARLDSQGRSLVLYGMPSSNYTLQYNTKISGSAAWQPILSYTLTNSFLFVTNLASSNQSVFYRINRP